MTVNEARLERYIEQMTGGRAVLYRCSSSPPVVSTRACVHCAKPYQITTPYELCNPGARDLCDDCLVKGIQLP